MLAAMFVMAGVMKSTQPKDKLAEKLPWVEDFSTGAVRLIGVVEPAAALGLILPAAPGVLPILAEVVAWSRFGPCPVRGRVGTRSPCG
ncbi:DoxX family protein [Actinocorallia herbida]|uniref:DoxX family protein n=1 Tax=Actinocorallia herbida TaxID=58109 RepID=UPI001FE7D45C|nr:DoxX family protein [Actinocorallia herbida]